MKAPDIGPMEAWFVGIPRAERHRRLFVVLQAYVDESGDDELSSVFVFAGYVGKIAAFDKFADGWKALLRLPKPLAYLKFKEAAKLRGAFHGWTKEERNAKIAALYKFALRNTDFSFSVVITRKDFEDAKLAVGRKVIDWNPWTSAFTGVFAVIHQYQQIFGMNERVGFIFDEKKKYAGRVYDAWSQFRGRTEPSISEMLGPSPPAFFSDNDIMPLQAADFLAGYIRCRLHRELTGETLADFGIDEPLSDPESGDSAHYHLEMQIHKDDLLRQLASSVTVNPKSGPRKP